MKKVSKTILVSLGSVFLGMTLFYLHTQAATTYTNPVSVTVDSAFTITDPGGLTFTITPEQEDTQSFSFRVSSNDPQGHSVSLEIEDVENTGGQLCVDDNSDNTCDNTIYFDTDEVSAAATGTSTVAGDLLATAAADGTLANGYTVKIVANDTLTDVASITTDEVGDLVIEVDTDGAGTDPTWADVVTEAATAVNFTPTITSPSNSGDTVVTADAQTITLSGGTGSTYLDINSVTDTGGAYNAASVSSSTDVRFGATAEDIIDTTNLETVSSNRIDVSFGAFADNSVPSENYKGSIIITLTPKP